MKNEGQLGFSGYVSDLVKDPNTDLNMKGEIEKLSAAAPICSRQESSMERS